MKSALMLGVNPNAIREKNDFYATNPHALEIAMPILCGSVRVDKGIYLRF